MQEKRIDQQVEFLLRMDQLKEVIRRNHVNEGKRLENTAEHSWHVALQAVLFIEYADEPVDILRVLMMLLIHDVVEILAGDTYIYAPDKADQKGKEMEAARTLFGMLPEDQGSRLNDLWEEFESRASPDARFAKAMDRLLPFLQNYNAGGKSWREHGVTSEMVAENLLNIRPGSEALWGYASRLLQRAVKAGMFLH